MEELIKQLQDKIKELEEKIWNLERYCERVGEEVPEAPYYYRD